MDFLKTVCEYVCACVRERGGGERERQRERERDKVFRGLMGGSCYLIV